MNNRILSLIIYLFLINSSISMFKLIYYDTPTHANPTNNKLCLILVDGLKLDGIENMTFIKELIERKKATLSTSIVDKPTVSRPGYMRMLTGSPPEINGIFFNFQHMPSPILSVSDLCILSKYSTALCGYFWVYELFPYTFNFKRIYFIRDGQTFSDSFEIIQKHEPDFILIHPMSVDNAGDRYGGKSIEYKKSIEYVDKQISKLYYNLINKGYIVIITSDHGQLDSGGHKLYDKSTYLTPFVFINNDNNNIKVPSTINQIDIAPTICDILGIPKTVYMTGDSIIDNSNIYFLRTPHILNHNSSFCQNLFISLSITTTLLALHLILYISIILVIYKIINNILS